MGAMTRTRQLHINAMKFLFSLTAIVVGLVVLGETFISAVWEPERSPEFSTVQGTGADGHLRWTEVTATEESKSSESIFLAAQKSGLPSAFLDKPKAVITPGATLIFTDRPIDPTTQSAPNFQILVAQKDKPAAKVE
jgi:hypothetical protein